jgi:hypothetical protein
MMPVKPDLRMTTTEFNNLLFLLDQARHKIKGTELDTEQSKLILIATQRIESEVYLAGI